MTALTDDAAEPTSSSAHVEAGALPAWDVGQLPEPPRPGWQLWIGLLGPGIVLAGTSIGTGEWLFGPAVTAQYGAIVLWLASISIILQVFCNLMMMRYAVYCGEPIIVGGLRTWPGPRLWICCYLLLDIGAIWPYNASNAAVPLAAAILGHLPGPDDLMTVKFYGYAIFLAAFVPLIFGGTIYRMIEGIMSFKLVYVLGYLVIVTSFMVSASVAWEVFSGFFRFGTVPLRAETIVAGPHFNLFESSGDMSYRMTGTVENGSPNVFEFQADGQSESETFRIGKPIPPEYQDVYDEMRQRAGELAQPNRYFVQSRQGEFVLSAVGVTRPNGEWIPESFQVRGPDQDRTYSRLADIPDPFAAQFKEWIEHQGLEYVNLFGYTVRSGHLPPLDWAKLAAFCAIAGIGGLGNTLSSNYTRDKGWGMGIHVGAIPSAIGGRSISLSHVGRVFPVDSANRARWRGWIRHITRDQMIWMLASFVGMALPCMLSLEFLRNATVEGNRVAAMSAEGMAARFPEYRTLFWSLTLLCGFVILAPGQVSVCDQIARRWTDIIWSSSNSAKGLSGSQVRYIYYGILTLYGVWGLVALTYFDPLQIATIGAVTGNVALGFSALHAWYANRSLLPRELQPHPLLQAGTIACGLFFLGITIVVVWTLPWKS